MNNKMNKLILLGFFVLTLPYWIKPVYECVHEKAVDIGLGKGDKVALYMDASAISDTFNIKETVKISEYSPANAHRGSLMKVYPVYLRSKNRGRYYLSYPETQNGEPTLETSIDAKKVHMIDFYFRDEIQLSVGVRN